VGIIYWGSRWGTSWGTTNLQIKIPLEADVGSDNFFHTFPYSV